MSKQLRSLLGKPTKKIYNAQNSLFNVAMNWCCHQTIQFFLSVLSIPLIVRDQRYAGRVLRIRCRRCLLVIPLVCFKNTCHHVTNIGFDVRPNGTTLVRFCCQLPCIHARIYANWHPTVYHYNSHYICHHYERGYHIETLYNSQCDFFWLWFIYEQLTRIELRHAIIFS